MTIFSGYMARRFGLTLVAAVTAFLWTVATESPEAQAAVCSYSLSDNSVEVTSATVPNGGGTVTVTAKAKIKSGPGCTAQSVTAIFPVTFTDPAPNPNYVDDGSFSPSATCNLDFAGFTTSASNNGLASNGTTDTVSCSRSYVIPAPNGNGTNNKYRVTATFGAQASGTPTVGAPTQTVKTVDVDRLAAPTPCTYQLVDTELMLSKTQVANGGETITATAKAAIQSKGSNCAQAISSVIPVSFSDGAPNGTYTDDGNFLNNISTCNLAVSGSTGPDNNDKTTPPFSCSVSYVVPAPNGAQDNDKYQIEATFGGSTSGTPAVSAPQQTTKNGTVTRNAPPPGELTVTVTAVPPIYNPGDIVTFNYSVFNSGTAATPASSVNPPWTLDNPGSGFNFTPADPCDISGIAPGETRVCTATYQTDASPAIQSVDTSTTIQGKFSNDWSFKISEATAYSKQLSEAWTFDFSADRPIYEEGKQVIFTGVVTNIAFPKPDLKIKFGDILLVINGGTAISPTICSDPGPNIMLAVGFPLTCTWTYGVTQEDLDAGKIVAVATVKADWKQNNKDLTLSGSEILLSEGSAADIVQNTVGSFIKRRMDMMLADEPTGYKMRNRQGGAGGGVPVAFTGTLMNGTTNMAFATSNMAFATSSQALSAAATAGSVRSGATGKGSLPSDNVVPTADAIIVSESDYNWWVEGKYTAYDSGDESDDTDRSGSFGIIYAGIDRKISDKTIIGVMLSLDWAQESADSLASVYAGESDVSGLGWMVGPYISTALTDSVFLDVRAAYGMSDNDIDIDIMDMPFSGGFQTTRWLVQAAISGQYQWGKFTFVPEATVSYMNERQKSFDVSSGDTDLDVGSQSYSLGRLRVGPEISVRQEWEKGSFTPYLKPSLIWDFASEGQVIVSGDANLDGEVDDMGDLRAAIEGGLRTESDSGVTSSMSVTYDGIGVDLGAITFTGNLSIPF